MDQPISCQDINYIYKHPLSILIHLKYQDKDGCSKNGSREFLIEIGFRGKNWSRDYKDKIILDSRGVPIYLIVKSSVQLKYAKVVLNFRTCGLFYQSTIPYVPTDKESMIRLQRLLQIGDSTKDIEDWFNMPFFGVSYISSVHGHVVGHCSVDYESRIKFRNENCLDLLSSLEQLPYLKSMLCSIEELDYSFQESFGRILGSRLAYMEVVVRSANLDLIHFESCLHQFTRLRYLKLYIQSTLFNPGGSLLHLSNELILVLFFSDCISSLTQLVVLDCSHLHFAGFSFFNSDGPSFFIVV